MLDKDNAIGRSGKGIIVGLLILLAFELYLHNEDFLHRYRSVFAVGRAADKIEYAAQVQPGIIFLGNSRVDNGIAPKVVASTLGVQKEEVFNLGIPGMNTRVLYGVIRKLEQRKALAPKITRCVLIGMDSTLLTTEDTLNYSVFLADRFKMLKYEEYRPLLASIFRMWGFATNLKGLREPAKLRDFFAATLSDRDPWGGNVHDNLGFRAKKEKLDNRKTIPDFDVGEKTTPFPKVSVRYLLDTVDLLQARGVKVGIFFPPQFAHTNIFERNDNLSPSATNLLAAFKSRNIGIYSVVSAGEFPAQLYANPGHLNEDGAIRYSRALSDLIRTDCLPTGVIH